jgi:hypothetical protein
MSTKPAPRYVLKLRKRDWIGRLAFWIVRRRMNRDRYYFVRRFTGPRPKGTNQSCTLKSNATAYRYYLERRPYIVGR